MKATCHKYILDFKVPSGTSRGIMQTKETWFIILKEGNKTGIGECGILRGLSFDDVPDYEEKLRWVCENINLGEDELYLEMKNYPSIQFGIEMVFLSLQSENPFDLFPSDFTIGKKSMEINGLIWMGKETEMQRQIEDKIASGFTCVKLKIGAINFDEELQLLSGIRSKFSKKEIEIRVDANGAFNSNDALTKLNQLSGYDLHSVEQPIAAKQYDSMSELCKATPIPIALDEELIGVIDLDKKEELLLKIKPQYLIFKPSFIGGFRGTLEWIALAKKHDIDWWITSALESNIGLNAIAQFTFTQNNLMPQGLGTGSLYTNNFDSPLEVSNGKLHYSKEIKWDVDFDIF
ncbi:MAG: O-succinylbenzoate synthase [Flavobacterium sp.]|jgi:O-succinylbenzoate synthase